MQKQPVFAQQVTQEKKNLSMVQGSWYIFDFIVLTSEVVFWNLCFTQMICTETGLQILVHEIMPHQASDP